MSFSVSGVVEVVSTLVVFAVVAILVVVALACLKLRSVFNCCAGGETNYHVAYASITRRYVFKARR